jgi:hypothetical protein
MISDVVDGIVIPPTLITKIIEGEVNEFFIEHVNELDQKVGYMVANTTRKIIASKDVEAVVEILVIKVVAVYSRQL